MTNTKQHALVTVTESDDASILNVICAVLETSGQMLLIAPLTAVNGRMVPDRDDCHWIFDDQAKAYAA